MNWNDLSRYRAPLMGFAMIIVMLFHTPLPGNDLFYGLMRCGNNGVDMFLFLSGIGLWFSWTRPLPTSPRGRSAYGQTSVQGASPLNENYGQTPPPQGTPPPRGGWERFYYRRFLRLYPSWLIIACLYYIPQYWPHGGGYSPNIYHLIANILTGWSFWRIDDLTFWFVPAIMVLYLIAPFYMRLIQHNRVWRWLPVLMIVWYLLVRDYPPLWKAVGHVEIFWSRIPVFLLGINAGEWAKALPTSPKGRNAYGQSGQDHTAPLPVGKGYGSASKAREWGRGKDSSLFTILSSFFFLLSLWYCVYIESHRRGAFPPASERMVYIPLAVSGMFLMCKFFRYAPKWIVRCFTFIGGISLEIYLIHIQFVLVYIKPYHLGYWPTFLLMLAISIPLAWLLSRLVSLLIKPLPKNL